MARSNPGVRPVRTLVSLAALVAVVFATLAAGVRWSDATWGPQLGLDLAGGTQIVLTPVVEPGQGEITDQTITDAIAIIRQRVDSTGVSEAQVSSQGGRNIIVELPGDPAEQADARRLVAQSAQMRFRPVLVEQSAIAATAPAPTGTATPAPTDGATPAPATPLPEAPSAAPVPSQAPAGRAVPRALLDATPTPAAPAPEALATPAAPTPAAATPVPEPTDASDLNQVTEQLAAEFEALDCTDPASLAGGMTDDINAPLVTCSQDGSLRYILGPVEVEGVDIDSASAGLRTTPQGFTTNEWVVNLEFDAEGTRAFRSVTERLVTLSPPQNQFAIVLDGLVVSAPRTNDPITDGRAEISGSFTQESATQLANQLKFGALPISFEVQTEEQISALLGDEQLQRGLLAGAIGMLLVILYSLLQYRALGLVTVASLVVVGVLTYGLITVMSWYQGYRLSLAGVAGLIVAIGITADSFIVYFERIRDEVREGRSLTAAVDTGWRRARRTIVVSDAINFLAAAVLYLLAVGGVRGFAFTLGLTTVLDLVVVFLFTHPVVALLARTRFFGGGHRLSGFDAEHLGRTVAYAGRGRLRTPAAGVPTAFTGPEGPSTPGSGRPTIADRKAAAAQAGETPSTGPESGPRSDDVTPGAAAKET